MKRGDKMKKYAAISTGGYISRHGYSFLHRDLRAQKPERRRLVPQHCYVDLDDSSEYRDIFDEPKPDDLVYRHFEVIGNKLVEVVVLDP